MRFPYDIRPRHLAVRFRSTITTATLQTLPPGSSTTVRNSDPSEMAPERLLPVEPNSLFELFSAKKPNIEPYKIDKFKQ